MKNALLIALIIFPFLYTFAQSREIKGVVIAASDKLPLPGVNVMVKKTTIGSATNEKGEFTITVPATTVTLFFSFIGYVSKEVIVQEKETYIKVILIEDVKALSEVVVIGYGSSSRKDITGSVSTLSGKVAGVRVRGAAGGKVSKKAPIGHIADEEIVSHKEVVNNGTAGSAGILTAGEIHDFSKWKLWEDIAKDDLAEWQRYWRISPLQRYTLQLVSTDGFAVVDAPVHLKDESGNILWQSRSDNTGKAELWKEMFSHSQSQALTIIATIDGKTYQVNKPTVFHQGINTIKVNRPCNIPDVVDIAFVVDATGSMGDEISYLQAELNDVITKVKDSLQHTTINLGTVFYRDAGDEYVTRISALSSNIQTTINFIRNQHAAGGGDTPEAVDKALEAAIGGLTWSKDAKARLLFLILDAPPHYNKPVLDSIHSLIAKAAAKGVRIIPIAASGIDKSTEYLMRTFALATNGTYLFLTDHSGVGNPHIKPTTDAYEVELLNALLIKTIAKFTQVNSCEQAAQASVSLVDTVIQSSVATSLLASVDSREIHASGVKNSSDSVDSQVSYTWKYYPNPTKDIITIETFRSTGEVFITDVSGKIIIRKESRGNSMEINMLSYPNGIYFIKLYRNKKWETARFLVSR